MAHAAVSSKAVILFLLTFCLFLLLLWESVIVLCCTLIYVHSSIAIILMEKRELVALLNLSCWCLVMVERRFLAVPRGCLRFVMIVVFPDHTHLLFLGVSGSELSFSKRNYIGNVFPRGISQYLLYMSSEPLVMNLDIRVL